MSARAHPTALPANTMRPSDPQEPPAGRGGIGKRDRRSSRRGDFLRAGHPRKTRSIVPSGEKNGARAPSVPFSRTASRRSNRRTYSSHVLGARSQADQASVRPSRETASAGARRSKNVPAAGAIWKRTTGGASGAGRRTVCHSAVSAISVHAAVMLHGARSLAIDGLSGPTGAGGLNDVGPEPAVVTGGRNR